MDFVTRSISIEINHSWIKTCLIKMSTCYFACKNKHSSTGKHSQEDLSRNSKFRITVCSPYDMRDAERL